MFAWLGKLLKPRTIVVNRRVAAKYDAAQTTDENRRHWVQSDALSARLANNLAVRKKLRERSRYEAANNGWYYGAVDTLANDTVGTGPRLNFLSASEPANEAVETAFEEWMQATGLVEKLRTLRMVRAVDGEGFARLVTNDALPTAVKLDVQLLECDQVTARPGSMVDITFTDGLPSVDGIAFDAAGNPLQYTVLRLHPSEGVGLGINDYFTVPARNMVHWFKRLRPGQVRGIPEFTPALGLFALLRRGCLATLAAFEIAASFAATLESKTSEDTEDIPDPFETMEIERGMLTTMPDGWHMNQFKPEQPTGNYEMFERRILMQIGRCINMPYILLAQDSSSSNFATARLDLLNYRGSTRVERSSCVDSVLNRIFMAWLEEAVMVPDLLPAEVEPANAKWIFHWQGWPSIDPYKDALATDISLGNGSLTLREARAANDTPLDWDDGLDQQAAEKVKRDELGLPQPAPKYQIKPDASNPAQVDQATQEVPQNA